MKNALVLILSLVMLLCAFVACDNDREAEKSEGSENVTFSVADEVENNEEKDDECLEKVVQVKETYYDEDGEIDHWIEYFYDEKGNRVKMIEFYEDSADVTEYEYDEKGLMVKELWYSEYRGEYDYDGGWNSYEYDAEGRLIKETNYPDEGDDSINYWYEYTYDENGNVTKNIWVDADGSIFEEIIYKYDDKGNVIEENNFRESKSIKYVYEYDENGNVMKKMRYTDLGELVSSWSYSYDEDGRLSEYTSSFGFDKSSYTEKYEYDELGNCVKVTEFDDDGELREAVEYEYKSIKVSA